jgi:iron complex transport system ATP-binding protein
MSLRAEGVEFGYVPGRAVLRGVSCALDGGRVTAIVGPNAAGKSTLLRLLLGTLRAWSGRVTLDGRDVPGLPYRERARRIAYIAQRSSVAFAFTVREVVRMGRFAAGTGWRADERAAGAALRRVGLLDRADEPFGVLSAGQQQRAMLARALAQLDTRRPAAAPGRMLLADEPAAAMDPRHAIETLGLFRELASGGVGVGVVLHDLTLAARFADRAVVLDGSGRVAADGPVGAALDPAVLEGVFGVRFDRLQGSMPSSVALIPAASATR